MWQRIPYAGLVLILGLTASDAHGVTASAAEISDGINAARVRPVQAITLSGEGQLDLQFFHAAFTGQATHLGRTHIDGPSQVDVVSATQTGTSTLMAAKGDTLVIAFSGTVTFTGPDPADPVLFAGTWNVIDGTGRFAGSSGGGSYGGNAAGPAGTLLLDGSISGPGNGN